MILRCLIVDDEPPAVKIIENYLSRLPDVEVIGKAGNALEAMTILRENETDVLFLDVNMPEISGMELLKILIDPPEIILTTAYSEYALESYEYNVTDYLLKPIRFERFIRALEKARIARQSMALQKQTDHVQSAGSIEFKVDGIQRKVPVQDILYIQSLGNYIKIFTAHKSYVALLTTKETETLLPKQQFVRIHKSFIINLKKIESFDQETVRMPGAQLPIGKTYKKYFSEIATKFS